LHNTQLYWAEDVIVVMATSEMGTK